MSLRQELRERRRRNREIKLNQNLINLCLLETEDRRAHVSMLNFMLESTGFVFELEMLLHRGISDEEHERPERIMAIYMNLITKGIYSELTPI